ncbi:MAG TPA: hypothetical protein VI248_29875 [Kineosporiaceae bacterium]
MVGLVGDVACFTATACDGYEGGAPWFGFAMADRRVTCYYFYVWDEDFGAAGNHAAACRLVGADPDRVRPVTS